MYFGKEWGEENGCADLRNTAWSLLSENSQLDFRNLKWFVIMVFLNGLWRCLNWQSSSLSLHPGAHQPVITSHLGIHLCLQTFLSALCVLIFIDFFDLEEMLTKALKAWGEQQHERRGGPGVSCVFSRIVIANSQVPILGSYLRSCWQQQKNAT